ncbi:MAG: hypothetical protein Ta2G_12330 [Termitinemataceae bacterium]|nr:MAG: hypothetical protein Ta2G_12330 [Termitinemataceae bacterium]
MKQKCSSFLFGIMGALMGTSKNSCAAILHCLLPHLFGSNAQQKTILLALFAFKLQQNPAQSCVPLVFRGALIINCFLFAGPVFAATEVPEISAAAAVVMDASSGMIVYAKNPYEKIPPASLTKLMTIYVAMDLAAQRGILLDERFSVPPESWWRNQPPRSSLMWLEEDHAVSLRELFLGLAVPSGNDAAVAVALKFSPSVKEFAGLMNKEAAKLGLRSTYFVEPSGVSEENMTNASDFAIFCRKYIYTYPQNLLDYHSVPEFLYPMPENLPQFKKNNPRTRIHTNHVSLMGSFEGVDGLKTGYIDESGYNLALTALQNDTRFIIVLLGVPKEAGGYWGPRKRDADGRALLQWAFDNYQTVRPTLPKIPAAKVWKGKKSLMNVIPFHTGAGYPLSESPSIIYPLDSFTVETGTTLENLTWNLKMNHLVAPFDAMTEAGTLDLYSDGKFIAGIKLLASEPCEKGALIKRFFHSIAMFFRGISG